MLNLLISSWQKLGMDLGLRFWVLSEAKVGRGQKPRHRIRRVKGASHGRGKIGKIKSRSRERGNSAFVNPPKNK